MNDTRPTPETDANLIRQEATGNMMVLPDFARRLERERDETRATCEELVTDSNAVTLAQTVVRLERERNAIREAIKGAHHALTVCATDEDALDVDDMPTSSGAHMTPEQREPLLSDYRVRCLVASRKALAKLKPFLP